MRLHKWRPTPKNGILILCILILGISACKRDLIFSDELMNLYAGDEMLSISYQVERTEYREYHDSDNPLLISRSVPINEKERFDLKLNRTGEIETFLEVLSPSQNFEFNESLPSTSEKVKFVHYKNGRLKSFDRNRTLIGEAEVPYLQEGYAKLFSGLHERSSHGEILKAQISGGLLWGTDWESTPVTSSNHPINGRISVGIENPYDQHQDFKVLRNTYTADDGKSYVTELIIHKPSNTVRFMSDYDSNQKAVTRVFFTYENVDGSPQLKATHEEHLSQNEHSGSAKQIIISTYDFYHINLNL